MQCSMSDIGARIAALRNKRGLSQEELSKKLNIGREVVAKWENGTRDLKTQYTVMLADFFGVTCDEILRDKKAENVGIEKEIGLSNSSIDKLRELKHECDNIELERQAVLSGQLALENCQYMGRRDMNVDSILEAINMLLSVDKMEHFFWAFYLYMWRVFYKNAEIDVNRLTFGYERLILTPEQLEKILLVDMQEFMIMAREKIAAEHDAKADSFEKASWEAEKRRQKEYAKKGIITQAEYQDWLEVMSPKK